MQWLNTVGHDMRNGWRLLRKSPVLSAATIATLALGIGLDTVVFTRAFLLIATAVAAMLGPAPRGVSRSRSRTSSGLKPLRGD
jgi:hypothetical protein